jgi:hypothetical protein
MQVEPIQTFAAEIENLIWPKRGDVLHDVCA